MWGCVRCTANPANFILFKHPYILVTKTGDLSNLTAVSDIELAVASSSEITLVTTDGRILRSPMNILHMGQPYVPRSITIPNNFGGSEVVQLSKSDSVTLATLTDQGIVYYWGTCGLGNA